MKNKLRLTEEEIIQPADTAEATAELQDSGIAGLLNSLIRDEWEAVDNYQSAITTISEMSPEIVKILDDILTEEMVHIGQLQKALNLVQPESLSITHGEDEAEEQLVLK